MAKRTSTTTTQPAVEKATTKHRTPLERAAWLKEKAAALETEARANLEARRKRLQEQLRNVEADLLTIAVEADEKPFKG